MKKLLSFITILLLFFTIINVKAEELNINSKYAVLYNLNEEKNLFEKDKSQKIPIASLTKIMTCLLSIENIDELNTKVTITNKMLEGLNGLSKAGFKLGETVTYYDLLYGAMLPSGADATNALAISISGSVENFVTLMNKKAEELKLFNTHFVNTTGLDSDNHYSTVDDVAKLLNYALKNKEFRKIFQTKKYETTNGLDLQSTLVKNGKKFNLNYEFILGSKTGFTDAAGLCMASNTTKDNIDFILVTCGANTKDNVPYQVMDAITIYNYYFEHYSYKDILKKGTLLITIPVFKSYTEKIDFKSDRTIQKYLSNEYDMTKIKYEYDGLNKLEPKNKKGDKIGIIKIKYNNEILDTYDVVLKQKIKSNLVDRVILYLGISLATFILILIIKDIIFKRK